ncbi:MAG: hypothetical protein KIH63_003685 [Candidatus Saccharibacteria bacterium]|nr:hypothetical protein [Candidatus Saccharibacteria bacterium]
MKKVDVRYLPFAVEGTFDDDLVALAGEELAYRAALDPFRSAGYFPGFAPDDELEACIAFAQRYPQIEVAGHDMGFSFLRLSLGAQSSLAAFHLDGNAQVGFTEDVDPSREAWRAIFNLSSTTPKFFGYSQASPWEMTMSVENGYFRVEQGIELAEEMLEMPKRSGQHSSGVVACVTQLLHVGKVSHQGEFIVSYGTA